MGPNVAHETKTEDRPGLTKELVRPMSPTWYLQNTAYTLFMVRDLTSVFIAGYCVFLMVLRYRANQGEDAFKTFYESLKSPVSLVLHAIALVFAAYHSITFFNLTPRVMVVFRGDEKVPEGMISGGHFALWAVVSAAMIVLVLMVV